MKHTAQKKIHNKPKRILCKQFNKISKEQKSTEKKR